MTNTASPQIRQSLTIIVTVIASCLLLFSIDKDTHSFADLMKPGNLMALVVYAFPTLLVCFGIFHILRRAASGRRLFMALLLGIPLSFTLIIGAFLLLRG